MKISIRFERSDILPALLWAGWAAVFILLFVSVTGSIGEFEPSAAAVWAGLTVLWCVPPAAFFVYKYKTKRGK